MRPNRVVVRSAQIESRLPATRAPWLLRGVALSDAAQRVSIECAMPHTRIHYTYKKTSVACDLPEVLRGVEYKLNLTISNVTLTKCHSTILVRILGCAARTYGKMGGAALEWL